MFSVCTEREIGHLRTPQDAPGWATLALPVPEVHRSRAPTRSAPVLGAPGLRGLSGADCAPCAPLTALPVGAECRPCEGASVEGVGRSQAPAKRRPGADYQARGVGTERPGPSGV